MALALFAVILMPLGAIINDEYYEARKEAFDSQYSEYTRQDPQSSNSRVYRSPMLLPALARGTGPCMPVDYFFYERGHGDRVGYYRSAGIFNFLHVRKLRLSVSASDRFQLARHAAFLI